VLRDQPVLTAELGRRARERALQRYTLDGALNALEQLYADLLNSSISPAATLHSR
jgi:hypothetical protein